MIADSVAEYPDHVALEFFGRETTYAEFGDQIDRAAEGLRKLGVRKGDPVALVLPNCPQHVVAFYAILRLGAIVIEHNPLYTPRELRHQFEDHGAKVAIAWDKVVATLQDFPGDVAVDHIVSVDMTRAMPAPTALPPAAADPRGAQAARELTTKVADTCRGRSWSAGGASSRSVPGPTVDDVALIQYTSGTTGSPKGATLTHLNLGRERRAGPRLGADDPRGTASVHAVLPLFHAYGLTLCLTFAMSMGARLVLFPASTPSSCCR